MSTYKKSAGPARTAAPVAADIAAEADRRETLAGNTAYASGVAQAAQTFRDNCKRELDDCVASVKKTSLMRDVNAPGRQAYDRSYVRLEKVAQRYAGIIGGTVEIPEWHAPAVRAERTVSIGAAKEDRAYRETKGLGASGRGLPTPPIPGSAADTDWVQK